jgi:hypothetical protein
MWAPDALSRLHTAQADRDPAEGQIDVLHDYASIVQLDPALQEQLIEGYQTDQAWKKAIEIIVANEKAGEDAAKLPFARDPQGLLWKIDAATGDHAFLPDRLCLPESCIKIFLETAHSDSHLGFARCNDNISRQRYIRKLSSHLREFLRHCPQCQLYQTRQHLPY